MTALPKCGRSAWDLGCVKTPMRVAAQAITGRGKADIVAQESPTRKSGWGLVALSFKQALLSWFDQRAVAKPFHQDRVLAVIAVLHRVFDDPAEAGIIENTIVDDEAEGTNLTLATCCSAGQEDPLAP
jgi:hypothetical protein